MAVGDSNDILARVKLVLPGRWWAWVAPVRDAVLGGLSDSAAWCYSWITYARAQSRIATATGLWLDIIAWDFLSWHLQRRGTSDSVFRARIQASILQERVTRAGMISAVTATVGTSPRIFEPWNTFDTGAYGVGASGIAYNHGGGWGSLQLPGQVFIQVVHGNPPLTPNVAGYHTYAGGYGAGSIEYISPQQEAGFIETSQVYDVVNTTRPTGSIAWTHIN